MPCTRVISFLLPSALAPGNKNDITLIQGFNYTIYCILQIVRDKNVLRFSQIDW